MAFFGLVAKKEKRKITRDLTHITKNIRITGELISSSPLFIDSKVDGDLKVNNTVILSKRAVVEGNIQAKNVLVYGEVRGKIKTKNLEVYKGALVKGSMNVKKVYINGSVYGTIGGEGIFIDTNGVVKSSIQAKKTVISGNVEGVLASEHLALNHEGYVRGDVFVNHFERNDGRIEGMVSDFRDILTDEYKFSYDYEDSIEKMSNEVALYVDYENKIVDLIKRNLNNDTMLQNLIGMLKYSEENERKLNQILQAIEYKKEGKDSFIDVAYD